MKAYLLLEKWFEKLKVIFFGKKRECSWHFNLVWRKSSIKNPFRTKPLRTNPGVCFCKNG